MNQELQSTNLRLTNDLQELQTTYNHHSNPLKPTCNLRLTKAIHKQSHKQRL